MKTRRGFLKQCLATVAVCYGLTFKEAEADFEERAPEGTELSDLNELFKRVYADKVEDLMPNNSSFSLMRGDRKFTGDSDTIKVILRRDG